MSIPTDIISTSTDDKIATAPTGRKTGKGAKDRQELRYRQKKNKQFTDSLRASVFARLKISDPTDIGSIRTISNVVPSRIPVSLRAIPRLLAEVWDRMKAIGTRPFQALATDANKAVFFKVCLLLFEAKVCYAQRAAMVSRFETPTQFQFTDMQLRKIKSVSMRLPFPIAIALEHLGNFTVNDQPVVPVFVRVDPVAASGALSLARSDLRILVNQLRVPLAADNVVVNIARNIEDLPMVTWRLNPNGSTQLTDESVAFWAGADVWDPLPANERSLFLQIIASMESKKGFLLLTEIDHGDGSAVAAVRFHEPFDAEETETLYYMNTKVTEYEEQISAALLYGYEHQAITHSRFCGSYDEPLIHGSANQNEVRRALIWANRDH